MQQMKKRPKLLWIVIFHAVVTNIVAWMGYNDVAAIMVKIGIIMFVILWIQMFFYVRYANKVASKFYGIKWRNLFKKNGVD
jgi:hypothetical protein